MAAAGIASRRKCEVIIQEGRVSVNDEIVTELGRKIEPGRDRVFVDGRPIKQQRTMIVAMNKPKGVVTTMRDERGRKSVADLLPQMDVTLKPVGRLDMNTEGLLLFTNDGELAAQLTHPKHGVWKVYRATVKGEVTDKDLARLRKGLWIQGEDYGRKTAPALAERVKWNAKLGNSEVEISIHEGSKRQVRLMFESVGKPVVSLKRVKFGPIALGKLPSGACRLLSKTEEAQLRKESPSVGRVAPRKVAR